MSNTGPRYYINRNGPPTGGRVPNSQAEPPASSSSDNRRYYVSRGGPPVGGRIPVPVSSSSAIPAPAPAPAAAPATSSSAAPSGRQYYVSRSGPPSGGRTPQTSSAAETPSTPANRQYYVSRNGPPVTGRVPGSSSAPTPAVSAPTSTTAPIYFQGPKYAPVTIGTVSSGLPATLAAAWSHIYGIPVTAPPAYTPTAAAPAPAPADPTPPSQSAPAAPISLTIAQPPPYSANLGSSTISNLPNNAAGILHPPGGYCTFSLLPKGAGAADEQLSADFPRTGYLGHPESTVEDLIRGLYGEDVGEATEIGIAEYLNADGVLRCLRRFRVGDGVCGAMRCAEIGWNGGRGQGDKVILAWGRGPVGMLPS